MSLPSTRLTPFLKENCLRLTKKFIKWEVMSAFREKVDPRVVPEYDKVVKEPMWLNEVKKRLSDGAYNTLEMYVRDMELIWTNAMTFNPPEDLIHKWAEIGRKRFHEKMAVMPKTREGEYIANLTKLSKRVAFLTAALGREFDHTPTMAGSG
jgi:hypothetical protein